MIKTCIKCKKIINQKFITVNGRMLHPECFTCSECKKKIKDQFNSQDNDFYHPECYQKKFQMFCTVCKKALSNQWVSSGSRKYHEECYKKFIQLKCKICSKPIEGEYTHDSEGNYHPECYKDNKALKCSICSEMIEGQYIYDSWGNKTHTEHDKVKPSFCGCCYRVISEKTSKGSQKYQDGRVICGICQETEIIEHHQIIPCKMKVITQLNKAGFNYIPSMIKVTLDNKININKMLGASITSNTHGYTKTTTKSLGGQAVSKEHAIWMLYGLPKLLFEGVLAHELLHVWVSENNIALDHEEEEGFCNLGAALIYKNENNDFSKVLLKSLDEDEDKVYGDGYRTMKKILEEKGWKELLEFVKNNKPKTTNKFL
jgi:hypothetical protein